MPWITPNEALVLTQFTPGEQASLTAINGATDQLPAIASAVVAEIRGAITAGGYDVDPASAATLPPGLQNDFVAIARWRLLISMPQLAKLQTDKREQAFDKAIAKLDLIRRQAWAPESPTAALTTPAGRWNSQQKLIMRTQPIPDAATQFPVDANNYANPSAPADT